MAILLRDDPERAGFAILRLDPVPADTSAVSIQFLDNSFLAPDGRRTRQRHLFPLAPHGEPGTFALGSPVTTHVPEAEIVTLAEAGGALLGTIAWEGIRPPPGSGRGISVGRGSVPRTDPGGSEPDAARTRRDTGPEPEGPRVPGGTHEPTVRRDRPEPTPLARRRHRRRTIAFASGLFLVGVLLTGFAALVLSGRIGWEVAPEILSFAGRQGQSVDPPFGEAHLRARWYARPFAALASADFETDGLPSWPGASKAAAKGGAALRFTPSMSGLPPGEHRRRVPAVFPIGGTTAGLGVEIVLHIETPPVAPPTPAEPSTVDDGTCDRLAGSRFDPDHPAGAPSIDEAFGLPAEDVSRGILACDARTDRAGPERRLIVQRGRLLAAKALLRAAGGDLPGARHDMDDALAAWRTGSALGSAFADSLLGSYAFGSFNRPAQSFVQPDDAAAAAAWKRGMDRGSVIAQRNFAAQLLSGKGAATDPARAVALLRDAAGRGDDRAAGILGVALYRGSPPGVPADKAAGWALIVRAQCADKMSGDLLAGEIAAGSRPGSDRRACS